MSEHLHWFGGDVATKAVALPFDLEAIVGQWSGLRRRMVRDVPAAFSRDEWAYLAAFVDAVALRAVYTDTFGPAREPESCTALLRPRGPVALWLPNNVSLLGPLTLVLVSLTGNALRIKAGTRSDDLCSALVDWLLRHLDEGPLQRWLSEDVQVAALARTDPRQARWSEEAAVRMVFGSDAGAAAVAALPCAPTSATFAFVDKRSLCWAEVGALDDAALRTLIRVFTIYGRAGCTSPSELVLIDGDAADCQDIAARLLALWPDVVRADVDMHLASANVLSAQVAQALGWRTHMAPRHAAVICVGSHGLESVPGHLTLPISAAPLDQALAGLPANVQTIGHQVIDPSARRWQDALAASQAKRFVPLARMHHFGPVWDGVAFWRQLFEEVQVEGEVRR